ncbi:MAG: universal stress protein [Sterolibacterium sp.]
MTILVAYVPRPEGRAALDKGIEMAKRFNENLLVINVSAGTTMVDEFVSPEDVKQMEMQFAASGIQIEFKQLNRGNSPIEEIETLVNSLKASMLIIGLRKRSPVEKLFLGSVAQAILLSIPCPVLTVKALC